MPVRQSFRMEPLGYKWKEFQEILYFGCFLLIPVQKIQVAIKLNKKKRVLYMTNKLHFWSYLAQLFLELEILPTEVVEKIKIHFVFKNIFFPRKSCRL